MTLEGAMEIVSEHSELVLVEFNPDLKTAIKIAMEAMKVVDNLRFDGSPYYPNLLPGETED